jgi:hypothetical protein
MTHAEMERVTTGLTSKSDKMRALRAAGVSRSEIARFLGVRYQHVRNVEKDDERRAFTATPRPAEGHGGLAENSAAPFRVEPNEIVHLDTAPDGSLAIPRAVLAANGFAPDDRITMIPEGEGRIRMLSSMESIREAQEIVRRHAPPGTSLVDELFKMRRGEVEKEEREHLESKKRR